MTLAVFGPFTLTGECYFDGTSADVGTFVTTSVDHSAWHDYATRNGNSDWSAGTPVQIGYETDSSTGSPQFTGPNDGSTALASGNGNYFANVFTGIGSYLGSGGGATVPGCTFFGFYNSFT